MTEQAANTTGVKTIDVSRVVRHLNANFKAAIQKMGKRNEKGTKLHTLQVEFAYMIDEIQRGPVYLMPKVIADANDLIAGIQLEQIKAQQASKKAS